MSRWPYVQVQVISWCRQWDLSPAHPGRCACDDMCWPGAANLKYKVDGIVGLALTNHSEGVHLAAELSRVKTLNADVESSSSDVMKHRPQIRPSSVSLWCWTRSRRPPASVCLSSHIRPEDFQWQIEQIKAEELTGIIKFLLNDGGVDQVCLGHGPPLWVSLHVRLCLSVSRPRTLAELSPVGTSQLSKPPSTSLW